MSAVGNLGGKPVYCSHNLPFVASDGRRIHAMQTPGLIVVSPTLLRLLEGGSTVESAIRIADDLMTMPSDE